MAGTPYFCDDCGEEEAVVLWKSAKPVSLCVRCWSRRERLQIEVKMPKGQRTDSVLTLK